MHIHDRMRKAAALKKCVKALEDLQERFNPIFHDDPMVNGYLQQLRADIADLETLTAEERIVVAAREARKASDMEPAVIDLARSMAETKPAEQRDAFMNALLASWQQRGLTNIDAIVQSEMEQIEKENEK